MTELLPCAHCGNENPYVVIDHLGISRMWCDRCSSCVSHDGTHCSDQGTARIIDILVRKWNRRPEADDRDGDDE